MQRFAGSDKKAGADVGANCHHLERIVVIDDSFAWRDSELPGHGET